MRNSSCASWGRAGNRYRRPSSSCARIALPTAEQIRHGKLVKREQYAAFVATDAEGRLAVKLPKAPTYFDAFISNPGLWTVLGGLVVRNSCSADPVPLHGRAGGRLVGGRDHRGRRQESPSKA